MTKTKKTVNKTTAKKADAVKKAAVKKLIKQSSPKTATAKKLLFIDYPAEGENIRSGHYCLRIGGPHNADGVKVSVNNGAWHDCRPSQGYWWYDWWNFDTGNFCAHAAATVNGREVKSAKRKFKVII